MTGRATRWLTMLGLAAALLVAIGCAQTTRAGDDAGAVVERFLAARDARSLDAAMECFVEQPELRSSLGVSWSGRDIVRAILAYRLLDTYTVSDMRVAGNQVIWTENVRRGSDGSLAATFDEEVEAIVVGGHIRSLAVYVGGARPTLPNEPAPQFSIATDVLLPLTILLLVAGAVLVWPASTPLRPARPANSQLLSGLREYVARRG